MKYTLLLVAIFCNLLVASYACNPWSKVPLTGDPIPPTGAAATVIVGEHMWIHGGIKDLITDNVSSGDTNNTFYNETYKINLRTGVVHRINVVGARPSSRAFHMAWADPRGLGFYLGLGINYQLNPSLPPDTFTETLFDDFWFFDFSSLTYTLISSNLGSPSKRFGGGATVIDNTLVLLGGANAAFAGIGDAWVFDVITGLPWHAVPSVNNPTPNRFFHSAGIWKGNNHKLIMLGGITPTSGGGFNLLHEVWSYNWYSGIWFNYTMTGVNQPVQIMEEVRNNIHKDKLVVQTTDLGGSLPHLQNFTYNFDLNTGAWCQVQIAPEHAGPATKRTSFGIANVHNDDDEDKHKKLYVTLGWTYANGVQTWDNNLWSYTLNNNCACI